jgi:hypothetical protein
MVIFEACDRAPGLSRITTDITLGYVNWYWRVSAVVMWTPSHGLDDAVGTLAPFAGLNYGESSAGHWGRCTNSQHHKQPLCLLIVTLRMCRTCPGLHTAKFMFLRQFLMCLQHGIDVAWSACFANDCTAMYEDVPILPYSPSCFKCELPTVLASISSDIWWHEKDIGSCDCSADALCCRSDSALM